MNESELQVMVADYLRMQYPDVLFHSDFGSGIKLTMGQAIKQKRQNGGRRAWPDLLIAEPKREKVNIAVQANITNDKGDFFDAEIVVAHALFIELKKEGTRLKKKNGEWASEHIAEQADILERLRFRGYKAEFAVGFDQAREIIDEYLGKK